MSQRELEAAFTAGYAIGSVFKELQIQHARWGVQNRSFPEWLCILAKEVGELAEAVNETVFDNGPEAKRSCGRINARREAVQVAAAAIAFIEAIDHEENAMKYAALLKGAG